MATKSKSKKSAAHATHKKRDNQTVRRKQPLSEFFPNHMGQQSPEDNEPSLTAIMDLLVDISLRLSTNEQLIDDLRAEKMAEENRRLQSPSLTCATLVQVEATPGRWL